MMQVIGIKQGGWNNGVICDVKVF